MVELAARDLARHEIVDGFVLRQRVGERRQLRRTPRSPGTAGTGQQIDPRAADRALINTRRIWIAAFAFSAVTSALVGVLIGGSAA